jgi:glyoxylase-like metal-dependent hydrolase (beta-lactamase superfamily II)
MGVDDPYVLRLTPHVHAYVQPDGGWCLNNAGFVSDGGTTLLVDTAATERRARMLRDAMEASAVPRPDVLVNTHHHGDHTYGNWIFTPPRPSSSRTTSAGANNWPPDTPCTGAGPRPISATSGSPRRRSPTTTA